MGRRRKNRYRLKTGGLTISISLLCDFCEEKSDFEIAEEILIIQRYWNTLENLRRGGQYELKLIRRSSAQKERE
ncbi:hypothetical protein [Enterococcus sp.]|uniref:hypothetical protein n=1 Tax=Enterococcus sp. TaxID=35783 RepID=UPI003C7693C8